MGDEDIEDLISCYIDSEYKSSTTVEVNSIQVFKDCLYVDFEDEKDTENAVKFFNNYKFKSNRLEACLIDAGSKDDDVEQLNQSNLDEDDEPKLHGSLFSQNGNEDFFNSNKTKRKSNIDCEILVTNRQFK